MKIVFVVPSMKTGGGNRVFFEIANKLSENLDVEVIYPNNSLDKNTFEINRNINLISVGKLAISKFSKLKNLLNVIRYLNKKHKNDIVVVSDPIFSLFSCLLRMKRLYRFVQADDYRIFDDGAVLGMGILLQFYKKLCLYSYNYKTNFVFNSHFVYNQYCVDSKRTDVVYNVVHPAINHGVFKPLVKEREHQKQLQICLVARKHPSKGLQTFLNVWNVLPFEITQKIANVVLISHDDLSNFDTLGMRIVQPSSDIDIAQMYCQSDIFISTSWREGFGLPALEAMACGCACIISDAGGVNEYALPEENCLMFTPKDEEMLKQQLIRLVTDDNLRDRLTKEAVKKSFLFDWSLSAKQLIKIVN
ncbi:glycosyltransferase family 4 protein [Dysgonomonas sp. GY617]|uniref:glycosyltransferase family 4 protein n=1 Tax=Dysgonomonas sp. GY617 TaxID=2780420 RepID=UPI0018840C43|nr:glycosyltransferase family 4 protein [Dysgonomonas sp. GY617]MBF0576522.1 glycosyltransferase family 4 protein [Dysgonomonas sp. GY617]